MRKFDNRRREVRYSCFTLMEMVIVIAIIGLLAAIITPAYMRYLENSRVQVAKAQISVLKTAIADFNVDTGKYPKSLEELITSSGSKKWHGPYLADTNIVPKDPWDNEYIYTCPGGNNRAFDIVSYGKNSSAGGGDDVTSWVEE